MENLIPGGLPSVIPFGVTFQPILATFGGSGLFCFQLFYQQAVQG
jgi:hypothetical protein